MADVSVWNEDYRRTLDVLGDQQMKVNRLLEDTFYLEFTMVEWLNMFNINPAFTPCGPDYKNYNATQPIRIYFRRVVTTP